MYAVEFLKMKFPYDWSGVSTFPSTRLGSIPHLWEAIPVKDNSVKQLSKSKRLDEPATPPPRSLPLDLSAVLEAPNHALLFTQVPAEFEGSEQGVNCNGDAQLLGGIHAQKSTSERGANGRSEGGRQGRSCARVALAEGRR